MLTKREWVREKIERAKKSLGHPHGQWQSAHDLAESDHKVLEALLEEIEEELDQLKEYLGKNV